MFNQRVLPLLIGSTILSSIFSFVIIAMTIYHHYTIKQMIKENNKQ